MAILKLIGRFFAFWYDFIIGDDWTVAASIAAALLVTAVLNGAHVVAWWVVPLTVIVIVGISLRRASPKSSPHPRAVSSGTTEQPGYSKTRPDTKPS